MTVQGNALRLLAAVGLLCFGQQVADVPAQARGVGGAGVGVSRVGQQAAEVPAQARGVGGVGVGASRVGQQAAQAPPQARGGAPRAGQQAAEAPAQEIPRKPDLRVVRVKLSPDPVPAGDTATVAVMVHNRGTAAAAGSIQVRVIHDRVTPQPQPATRELLYLGADERVEVTFSVTGLDTAASPYTFFAMIDPMDRIDEAMESNNVTWGRASACDAPTAAESADGRDNDCDGLIDEELGLPVDTSVALAMLRELQERARRDRVPPLLALPRVFAPSAYEFPVRLISAAGFQVGADRTTDRQGATRWRFGARLPADDPTLALRIIDWNGPPLRSGDTIGFRTRLGEVVGAPGGGGGVVAPGGMLMPRETLFTILHADPAYRGAVILDGDAVHVGVASGAFWTAVESGGAAVRADEEVALGWETFTLQIPLGHAR